MVKKVLDLKEARMQIVYALPMILTNIFYSLVPIISVMFAGRVGELELAGSTLANSWATVTGYACMLGLSGALETLCGQAFGAKLYNMLGVFLQASCIISFFFCIIISILWWFTEPILILFHQSPQIAKQAAAYVRFLIPGIFAYGLLQNILRYIQAQSIIYPLVIFSFVPLVLHSGVTYLLVHFTTLGYKGAALATSITFWIAASSLIVYVCYSKNFKDAWNGVSKDAFRYILPNLNLALFSAAMVCLEYWVFEILVFMAGLMENSQATTSLVAICVNTETIAYMVTYGLSAATSTRVSNELGAGRFKEAKNAMFVTLKLSVLLTALMLLVLGLGHNLWAGLFTGSDNIIKAYALITPLLCTSILFDTFQGILSGVCRGRGSQHLAVCVNLATFYLIGLPLAGVLAFKFHMHVKGLWTGLICGLVTQCGSLFLMGVAECSSTLLNSVHLNYLNILLVIKCQRNIK